MGKTVKFKDWGMFAMVIDRKLTKNKVIDIGNSMSTIYNYVVMPKLGITLDLLAKNKKNGFGK